MYLGLKIHDNILVSYAYEHSTGKLANYTNATHEVLLGFVLDKSNKKSDKNRIKQKKEFDNIIQLQSEELDRVEQENKELKERIRQNEQDVNNLKEEIKRSQQNYLQNKDTIEKVIKIYKYDEPETKEDIEEADKEDIVNPSSYYVIVGATFEYENARLLQNILKREKQLDTKVISREDNKYLFVYTNKFETRKEAAKEIQRLKKLDISHLILGNIWIYKN